jgi:hypothetical protein
VAEYCDTVAGHADIEFERGDAVVERDFHGWQRVLRAQIPRTPMSLRVDALCLARPDDPHQQFRIVRDDAADALRDQFFHPLTSIDGPNDHRKASGLDRLRVDL